MCAATGREGRRSRRGRNGWRVKISPTGDDDDDGNSRAVGGCEGAESGEEGSVAGRDVDRAWNDPVTGLGRIVPAGARRECSSNASIEMGLETVRRPFSRISPQRPSLDSLQKRDRLVDQRTTLSSRSHPSTSSSSCTTLPRSRPPHRTPDPHLPSRSDPSSQTRRFFRHRSRGAVTSSSFGTRASRPLR